jgi:hypothetical protein
MTFPCMHKSSAWSPKFGFSDKNIVLISYLSIRATYLAHLILLDFNHPIIIVVVIFRKNKIFGNDNKN